MQVLAFFLESFEDLTLADPRQPVAAHLATGVLVS